MRRGLLFILVAIGVLMPSVAWCPPSEMLPIGSATGITAGLCAVGTSDRPAFIVILDQSVYYTLHSSTAVPGPTNGAVAPANTIIQVEHSSEFRAAPVAAAARAYVICLPSP